MNKLDPSKKYILFSGEPCNRQFYTMLKRALPYSMIENKILDAITKKSIPFLKKLDLYEQMECLSSEYSDTNYSSLDLKFTEEELRRGNKFLEQLGIKKDDWFVCIHARDESYFDGQYHDYRNSNIENLELTAKHIESQGGYVFRMGSVTSSKLGFESPNIIDYANKHRSDFLDIFLSAHCRFFLGNTSGIFLVATAFERPSLCANYIPLPFTPFKTFDYFIPKTYRDKTSGQPLTFQEILKKGLYGDIWKSEYFDSLNIEPIENSSEEILEMVEEFFETEKNGVSPSGEKADTYYKNEFLIIFDRTKEHADYASHISYRFMEKNRKLFEDLPALS